MSKRSQVSTVAIVFATVFLSVPAVAAPCAGFIDVEDTSAFCSNVEWLKNREITRGCATSAEYCPNDAVTRLAMAAFMNRLGVALTPSFIYRVDGYPSVDVAVGAILCASAPLVVTGAPRQALVDTVTHLGSSSSTQVACATSVYSEDDGITWTATGMGSCAALTPDGSSLASLPVLGMPLELSVGKAYRFGVRAITALGTPGTVGASCAVRVTVFNRNGAQSPYDMLQ